MDTVNRTARIDKDAAKVIEDMRDGQHRSFSNMVQMVLREALIEKGKLDKDGKYIA